MTSQNKTILRTGIVCLSLIGLAGCASQPTAAPDRASVEFPDPQSAWMDDGSYPNLQNLAKIGPGLSKDQIYDLVGRPHFRAGLAFVHEWNYLFQLPDGHGGYQACQYQIRFDGDMRVARTYWRDTTCATLLANALKQPVAAAPARTETHSVDARTLFAFDSAALSASGRQKVASIAKQVRGSFTDPAVRVVGYSDRIGSAEHNLALSLARADSVRQALLDAGLSPDRVESSGAGESRPVKDCPSSLNAAALRDCLQPNRRVVVEVRENAGNQSKTI